jgi:hypothetical protein
MAYPKFDLVIIRRNKYVYDVSYIQADDVQNTL